MMTRPFPTITRHEWPGFSVERAGAGCECDDGPPRKSFARAGALALAVFLVVVLAPPTQAQSLDQAVADALANNCQKMQPGPFGPELFFLCNPPPGFSTTVGPSGGSVTAQTRQAVTVEERRVLRRLEEKRRKIAKRSDPGSQMASISVQPSPWMPQPLGVQGASFHATMREPPPAETARGPIQITGVEIQEATSHFAIIQIQADQPVASYNTFVLSNPPRLVIDITGALMAESMSRKAAGQGPIIRIRASQYRWKPEPVVRVVLDLTSTLPYHVAGIPKPFRILVGEAVAKAGKAPPAVPSTVTAEQPKFAPGEVAQAPEAEEPLGRTVGLWGAGLYEAFDKNVTTFEPGYDSHKWGFTIGADYPFSERFIAGLAFNYSSEGGDFDNAGGDFTTTSYGGLLYASVLPAPNFFIDAYFEYARKDYSIDRRVSTDVDGIEISGIAAGETNGPEYKVGVNTGYDFFLTNVTIGPRFGFNYKHIDIDAFAERSDPLPTGLELAYDSQSVTSLTTNLGVFASVAISTGWGVLLPQVAAEWVHEFKDPQRTITFRFVQDLAGTPFVFQNDRPDRDYGNVGAGVVAVLPHGFVPFVSYVAQVGYTDQFKQTVAFGLRKEF